MAKADPMVNITASLDSAIADGESAQASLYKQRDALKAQMQTLAKQLHDLNKQLDEAETPELKKARLAKEFIAKLNSNQDMRPGQMRRLQRQG